MFVSSAFYVILNIGLTSVFQDLFVYPTPKSAANAFAALAPAAAKISTLPQGEGSLNFQFLLVLFASS
jgi:hypothetical protein